MITPNEGEIGDEHAFPACRRRKRLGPVGLVLEVAHDLFEEVLHGDQAGDVAAGTGDERELGPLAPQEGHRARDGRVG